MWNWLVGLFAMLSVLPFVTVAVIWAAVYYWKKDKRLALHWAVDIGTLFFLAASIEQLNQVANTSLAFWWWVIYVLIWAGGISTLQWWVRKRLSVQKTVKAVWRISFLTSIVVYVLTFIVFVFQTYSGN